MNPILAVELLFFAIFGQTTHESFKVQRKEQPDWTTVLFKLAFGIYMLVSVVVLINLLIAMMSDTYQRIQAQSDIEWKYGLSKLIRNMHRTTTAPAPLNLITTWLSYFFKVCKKRGIKKQRPSLMHLMGLHRSGRMSPRTKMGAKWLSKVKKTQVAHNDSIALSAGHLSPLGSQLSFSNALRIDSVVDWDSVRRKYRELFGGETEKIDDIKETIDEIEQPLLNEDSSNAAKLDNILECLLYANPAEITETLFFAIFGQKDTDDFTISLLKRLQPSWTILLFKVSFSAYMLVSVIVLITLLIAMMSDTYQRIVAQSDIEWKYGLSKLIRTMQKQKTAPSPLNLFTSWIIYLLKLCKKKRGKKKRLSVMRGFTAHRTSTGKRSGFSRLHQTPSPDNEIPIPVAKSINDIVDWRIISNKYRMRFGDLVEKPSSSESLNGDII
ncbi:hypothetical protein PV325_005268 [Microctonus aethiopoides]|nr:hypothetical protein PV325_005268 [Microctonus aethiopoides]